MRLLTTAMVLALSGCSCTESDPTYCDEKDPTCPAGQVCNTKTKTCVPMDGGAEQGTSTDLKMDGERPKDQLPGDVGIDGPHCGDGTKNGTEECDGKDLDGKTCASFGFAAGTLACKSCSFDQSGCKKWKVVTTPTTEDLQDVWASSATDVWVVGRKGTVLQYDGSKWSTGPAVPNGYGVIHVWGAGTDVWIMAGISVYQLKNSAWTSVLDKPVPLTGLWSDSPSSVHVTAVTSGEGQNYKSAHYQFDGQAWHEYPSVADRMYGGVWGVSSTDQWIFGGVMPAKITPTDFGEPLLRHYDGTNWTEETTATPVKGVVVDAWGTSATQLWALVLGGTILRRQGKMWYEITSPTQKNLWGIWGAGPSDMWAVGDGGTIIHYNGGAWSVVASPTTEDLKAIWGTTADDVWAVGNKGTILHLE